MRTLSVFLILASTVGAGVDSQPRPLQVSATKALNLPLFSAYGLPLVDQDGDMLFHLGGSFTNATIMKLSHSSFESTLYKLPSEVQDKYKFYTFTVSPSGQVWMLANAGEELLLVSFDSKGQAKGTTTLDLSLGDVNVNDFAALENDVIFVAGVGVGKKAAGHSFAGLFDGSTGRVIKNLRDVFSLESTSKEQPKIHQGEAVVGDDGNIYLLHETQIVVVSPAGEIVKRKSFEKPNSDLLPFHLVVSSGEAAVWLRTAPRSDHHFETSYLLIDLYNESPVGWYAGPPEVRMPAMGFSRNDGFEFLQAEKGQYKLITAQLR